MLSEVAEGVFVHQSPLLRNNSVVVTAGERALLVDPGVTGAELTCLARDLRRLGVRDLVGFATHPDWDHALWHPALGEARRYATAACAAFLSALRAQPDWVARFRAALPPEAVDDVPVDGFGLVEPLPPGGDRIPWGGPEVWVVAHPAHAVGHAALVVPGRSLLVAGDMVSDLFVPMPDIEGAEDPLGDYLRGLDRLASVATGIEVFVPGHGAPGDARALQERLEADRAYLTALRSGAEVVDPRVGDGVELGWEWVRDLHAGQVAALRRRRARG